MRSSRVVSVLRVAAVACLVTASGTAFVRAQAPQFRSTVELVQFQVVVRAQDGAFPTDLEAHDFALQVNGSARAVQVAYSVQLARGGASVEARAADGAAMPVELPAAARRRFLLLLDLGFTTRVGFLRARNAAAEFVADQIAPGDLVGIATAHPDFGLELVTPFTSEHDSVLASLRRSSPSDSPGLGEEPIDVGDADMNAMISGQLEDRMEGQVQAYMKQLGELGVVMTAVEGRKHVLLFSQGFADGLFEGRETVRAALRDMAERFRAADALVHAFDPLGMRTFDTGPEHQTSPFGNEGATSMTIRDGHQSLLAMAEATGGTVTWNTNDLSKGSAALVEDTRSYYVVGYRRERSDVGTLDIEVRVVRPGVQVVSAPRVLAPPAPYEEMSAAQRQLQLADTLANDAPRPGIEFETSVFPFPSTRAQGQVAVVARVLRDEIRMLSRARRSDAVELEVIAFIRNGQGRTIRAVRGSLGIENASEMGNRDRVVRFVGYGSVPAGPCSVRVVLREREVGMLSARTVACEVPAVLPSQAMVLAPVVLDREPGPIATNVSEDQNPLLVAEEQLVPRATREIEPGERLRLWVGAYGVAAGRLVAHVRGPGGVVAVTTAGAVYPLEEVRIVETDDRTGTEGQVRLVLDATLPRNLPAGEVRIQIAPPTEALGVHYAPGLWWSAARRSG